MLRNEHEESEQQHQSLTYILLLVIWSGTRSS